MERETLRRRLDTLAETAESRADGADDRRASVDTLTLPELVALEVAGYGDKQDDRQRPADPEPRAAVFVGQYWVGDVLIGWRDGGPPANGVEEVWLIPTQWTLAKLRAKADENGVARIEIRFGPAVGSEAPTG